MSGFRKDTRVQDIHLSLGLDGYHGIGRKTSGRTDIKWQDGKQVAGRISSGRAENKW